MKKLFVALALLLSVPVWADNVTTVNNFVIDYVRKGPDVVGGVPGVWNTQPSGAFILAAPHPWPRSFADPNPSQRITAEGVPTFLPDADQEARGIFGNEALAEYGIQIYRCLENTPGPEGKLVCAPGDPNTHRFVWVGGCPGQAVSCVIQGGVNVLGGVVGITHTLEKINGVPTGRFLLRVGIHGAPDHAPGVTDAILVAKDPLNKNNPSLPFIRCSDPSIPCDQQFAGVPLRAPLFPPGFTITLHAATTVASLNPVCGGMSEVDCMNSGIPGSFSAQYLKHITLAPCVAVRFTTVGGQIVPDIVNCQD